MNSVNLSGRIANIKPVHITRGGVSILEVCIAGTDSPVNNGVVRRCGYYHWVKLIGELAGQHAAVKIGEFAEIEGRLSHFGRGSDAALEIIALRLELIEASATIADGGGYSRSVRGLNRVSFDGVLNCPKVRATQGGKRVAHARIDHSPSNRNAFPVQVVAWDNPEFETVQTGKNVQISGRLVNDDVNGTRVLKVELTECNVLVLRQTLGAPVFDVAARVPVAAGLESQVARLADKTTAPPPSAAPATVGGDQPPTTTAPRKPSWFKRYATEDLNSPRDPARKVHGLDQDTPEETPDAYDPALHHTPDPGLQP